MFKLKVVLVLLLLVGVSACDRIDESRMVGSWTSISESIPQSWLKVVLGTFKGNGWDKAGGSIKTQLKLQKDRNFSQVTEVNITSLGDTPKDASGKPIYALKFENYGRWHLSHYNGLRLKVKGNSVTPMSEQTQQFLSANPDVKSAMENARGTLKGKVVKISPSQFTLSSHEKLIMEFQKTDN